MDVMNNRTQWTRIYAGSVLSGDNSTTSLCVGCIIIVWVETPSTPSFIC
jgi:hypothetical protein